MRWIESFLNIFIRTLSCQEPKSTRLLPPIIPSQDWSYSQLVIRWIWIVKYQGFEILRGRKSNYFKNWCDKSVFIASVGQTAAFPFSRFRHGLATVKPMQRMKTRRSARTSVCLLMHEGESIFVVLQMRHALECSIWSWWYDITWYDIWPMTERLLPSPTMFVQGAMNIEVYNL